MRSPADLADRPGARRRRQPQPNTRTCRPSRHARHVALNYSAATRACRGRRGARPAPDTALPALAGVRVRSRQCDAAGATERSSTAGDNVGAVGLLPAGTPPANMAAAEIGDRRWPSTCSPRAPSSCRAPGARHAGRPLRTRMRRGPCVVLDIAGGTPITLARRRPTPATLVFPLNVRCRRHSPPSPTSSSSSPAPRSKKRQHRRARHAAARRSRVCARPRRHAGPAGHARGRRPHRGRARRGKP